jgi:cytochrome P450
MAVIPNDPGWQFDHIDPLLSPRFNETFAAVRQRCPVYEPVLRELTRHRVIELTRRHEVDLVTELARYLPPIAIALVLGLPAEDGDRFVAMTTRLLATAGDPQANERANEEMRAYVAERMAQRRGDDTVIAAIANGDVGGHPLTPSEQIGMIVLLVVAGHETTVTPSAPCCTCWPPRTGCAGGWSTHRP